MIFKKNINNKKVIVEILTSNTEILKYKKKFMYDLYKNLNLSEILSKVNNGYLNFYIKIRVGDIVEHEELYNSNGNVMELMETLLVMFTSKENYEISHVINYLIDNIKF